MSARKTMPPRHAVSGMSLIEMAAIISISGVILGGSMVVLRHLQRLANADTSRGTRAEMACDQLRQDLTHGSVEILPHGLQIKTGDQRVHWQLVDGQVERDGRPMLTVDRFDAQLDAPLLTVIITPVGLPTRRIEATL